MRYLALCDAIDLELTLEQHIACAFLEGRGLRFAVDYGYTNAVALVQKIIGEWAKG